MLQSLPVLLAIVVSAAAVIAVLLWKLKPNTAGDTRLQELLSKLESRQAELTASKSEAAAATATATAGSQRAVEAERRFETARDENNTLRQRLTDAAPAVERARTEKEAAVKARGETETRLGEEVHRLQSMISELQAGLDALRPRAEKASAERQAACEAKTEVESRYGTLHQEYTALLKANHLTAERATTAETELKHWQQEAATLNEAVNDLRKGLTLANGKIMELTAEQRADEDAARMFENVSQKILKETLEEAKRGVHEMAEVFQKSSDEELEKHALKLTQTLEPLQVKLREYGIAVEGLKKNSQEVYGGLKQQLDSLQAAEQLLHTQAKALTSALSDSPKVRGNYGEMMLKQLVEFVGMQQHCHFSEQVSTNTDEGRKIPDMVIHLPEGQKVIVDAKAVMDACREAQLAEEEAQKAHHLKRHCDNVKSRIRELSAKNYFENHKDAVEVVVLFLPAENLYATAVETDPTLTQYALEKNIIICGPNSLMMLLKVANQIWRRASIEEEAEQIRKSGNEIYKYTTDFIMKYAKLGRSIKQLAGDYDDAAGTLDGRLIPAGRRLGGLASVTKGQDMAELPLLEVHTKQFRSEEAKARAFMHDANFATANGEGEIDSQLLLSEEA